MKKLGLSIAVATATLLSACQKEHSELLAAPAPSVESIPPSPTVKPDAKTRFWMLREDMVWEVGNTGVSITIPAGFVTDFASIPQSLWSFGLTPYDQYSRAAVIHDYLYWTQVCTKPQSDRLLLIAMKESDVGKFDEFAVYQGVDKFGKSSWETNADELKKGWPRIAPEGKRDLPPNGLWMTYREKLRADGVRDPVFVKNPSFCKYGDSTGVPYDAGRPPSNSSSFSTQAIAFPAGQESLPAETKSN